MRPIEKLGHDGSREKKTEEPLVLVPTESRWMRFAPWALCGFAGLAALAGVGMALLRQSKPREAAVAEEANTARSKAGADAVPRTEMRLPRPAARGVVATAAPATQEQAVAVVARSTTPQDLDGYASTNDWLEAVKAGKVKIKYKDPASVVRPPGVRDWAP